MAHLAPPDHLRESLISCMDAAEDALLLRADQAVSNASQNRYFEVLGDLRNQRRPLVEEFMRCWQDAQHATTGEETEPGVEGFDPTLRALGLLADVSVVAGNEPPLPLAPRFRTALGRALSRRALRAEGRLALLKAIESYCPAPADSTVGTAPAAWLQALAHDPFHLPDDPDACMQTLRARVAASESPRTAACDDALRQFLFAWEGLCRACGLPPPALAVLQQTRAAFAAAWLLCPDWFAEGGCGLELLADLVELLPGIEAVKPPYLPMVQRTMDTLAVHPERLPSVWLEWRLERMRRAELRREWLAAVQFEAQETAAMRAAARQVRDVLEQRMLNGHFPHAVLTLIGDGWSEVMMLGFLHPDDTGRMGRREAIRLLDALLNSVQPDLPKPERQAVMQQLPQLMRSLRTGLEQTGMKAPQVNELLHGLRGVHGPLVFGRGETSAIDWQHAGDDWFDAAFRGSVVQKQEAGSERADSCRVGHWIEFAGGGWAGLQRYRVVHVDAGQDLVALGNELQVVFEVLPQSQLASMFAEGAAEVFTVNGSAMPAFARALSA